MSKTVRLLTTKGDGKFIEVDWEKPDNKADEIEVRAVMTGVCRSDIDMMQGQFNLPMQMHGHEGLGIVTAVGDYIRDVKVGDYVATRGEPAYADYYNAKTATYVKVPALESKYIIEPVACAINVGASVEHSLYSATQIAIIGTGFLSSILYQWLTLNGLTFIDVIGNHNHPYWLLKHGVEVKNKVDRKYDVVYDLSNNDIALTRDIYVPNAALVLASTKHPAVASDFNYLLWNAVSITCPSPRTPTFYSCMDIAVEKIRDGEINVDGFWTKGYDRDTEWQQAFEDSLNRTSGFNRAYIYWP